MCSYINNAPTIYSVGLDRDPKFLADSMSPATTVEATLDSSILVAGGYNACQYQTNNQTSGNSSNSNNSSSCGSGWYGPVTSGLGVLADTDCVGVVSPGGPAPSTTAGANGCLNSDASFVTMTDDGNLYLWVNTIGTGNLIRYPMPGSHVLHTSNNIYVLYRTQARR